MRASTAQNRNLNRARAVQNDEFYTQLADIERELHHYSHHFQGKTVLCNCDDPRVSNFFRYFANRFEQLNLEKLVTTCYKSRNPDIFSRHDSEQAIYLEYNGDLSDNRMPDPNDIGVKNLCGDGDFRSEECVELLREADVVSTNPPFSLFREYVTQLIENEKKFLILGSMNAITYKEIFHYIKTDKIWLGVHNNPKKFGVPDDAEKFDDVQDGKKTVKMGNVFWFTNLDYDKRHEDSFLHKTYSPKTYPKYDNYDAINIDRTDNIPVDYAGVMGVPISFLDKHNPDQFEIIGFDYDVKEGHLPELVNPNWTGKIDRGYIGGKRKYSRIFIRNKRL